MNSPRNENQLSLDCPRCDQERIKRLRQGVGTDSIGLKCSEESTGWHVLNPTDKWEDTSVDDYHIECCGSRFDGCHRCLLIQHESKLITTEH